MRRVGSSGRVVSAALCAAISLAGCVPPAVAPRPESPAATSAPATSAPPSLSGTPAPASPSETASAEWKTFTTADDQLMFDYPPDWTINDRAAEAAPEDVFVEVLNGAGKSMAALRTNIVTGAECTEKYPYSLMDSEELPALAQGGVAPRFVFEGRAYPGTDPTTSNPMAYGIASAPQPSGPTACPIFHFFTWPPSGAMFGGVYNPFDTTAGNPPDVDTPEAYTETAECDDIREMITSLRPAG